MRWHSQISIMIPKNRVTATLCVLGAVCAAFWLFLRPSASIDSRIQPTLDEVGNGFETFFSLSAVNNGVFAGYGTAEGNRLLRYDTQSASFSDIPLPGSLSRIFVASPDRKLVLLSISEPSPRERNSYHPEHLFYAYDVVASRLMSVAGVGDPGKHPAWLDEHTLLCEGVRPGRKAPGFLICAFQVGQKWDLQEELSGPQLTSFPTKGAQISRHTSHSVCYFRDGEIRILDVSNRQERSVAALDDGFAEVSWLTYQPASDEFLFCGRRHDQSFRFLYVYSPASRTLRQLTSLHTYNGQWLQEGHGAAYIQNSSNSFSLRATNFHTHASWHFFPGGHVERYTVSHDGRSLFTVASTNAEPRGLWHCDVTTGEQRLLKAGNRVPFRSCAVSTPIEHGIPSSDGRLIPAYLFPPAQPAATSNSPVVIYIPPRTAQCTRGYELQAQILANLGFFYLGVNYRGCDGYGTGYAAQWSPDNAAKDVLDAVHWVRSDPRFSSSKIFLTGMSESALVLAKVIAVVPQEIQAAVFHSPVSFELATPKPGMRTPPLIITMGKTDPLAESARSTSGRLRAQGYSVEYREISDFAHPGVSDVKARLNQEQLAAEFILNAE